MSGVVHAAREGSTVWILLASAAGGLFGYWVLGIWFMLGRYSRTQGRATPDARIPWIMAAMTALAWSVYVGRFCGAW